MIQSNEMGEKEIKRDIKVLSDNIRDCLAIGPLLKGSHSMGKHVKELLEYAIGNFYQAWTDSQKGALRSFQVLQPIQSHYLI